MLTRPGAGPVGGVGVGVFCLSGLAVGPFALGGGLVGPGRRG